MRSPALMLGLLLVARTAAADDGDGCHGKHTAQKACDGDKACTWCKCAALPSACWTLADAKKLPSAVYQCDAKDEDEFGAEQLDSPLFAAEDKWDTWKALFEKVYPSDLDEKVAFMKFEATDARINAHNAKDLSWTLGHNAFSDLTPSEFAKIYTPHSMNRTGPFDFADLSAVNVTADALDWVAKGKVTKVKNQGSCGSCWTFSAVGAMEGAFAIGTGNLTDLSEEELVQCDNIWHGGMGSGCGGGKMDFAFKFVEKHGLCTEAEYPYSSGDGTTGHCVGGWLHGPSCKPVATVGGYVDVKSEDDLLKALTIGPVSIAIEADQTVFHSYKSGVIDSASCGTQLDHGVLLVGYGTDAASGKDYWKVKNSWAASWGEDGYVRMVRGKDMCGIASGPPSYPTGVGRK